MAFGISWASLKSLFKRSRKQPEGAHVFTDEDRQLAEIKRLQKKVQQEELDALKDRLEYLRSQKQKDLLEEQIEDMEEDLYGEDEEDDETPDLESPDALLSGLLMRVMQAPHGAMGAGAQGTVGQVRAAMQSAQGKKSLTDEQLRAIKEDLKAQYGSYYKMAMNMSDEQILEFARTNRPDLLEQYDQDTIDRALKILRE